MKYSEGFPVSKMHNTTIHNCPIVNLPKIHDQSGNITAIDELICVPFSIKRVYYLYDIPGGESRGGHAHKELHQLVIAASGSFDIIIDDATSTKNISLNRPYIGLHIVPGIWREIKNISSGAVCLVLASEKYLESDYIRDYNSFMSLKKDYD